MTSLVLCMANPPIADQVCINSYSGKKFSGMVISSDLAATSALNTNSDQTRSDMTDSDGEPADDHSDQDPSAGAPSQTAAMQASCLAPTLELTKLSRRPSHFEEPLLEARHLRPPSHGVKGDYHVNFSSPVATRSH